MLITFPATERPTKTGAGMSVAAVSSMYAVPRGSVSFTQRDGASWGPRLSSQIVYVITSFGSPVAGFTCIDRTTSGETARAGGGAAPRRRGRSRATARTNNRTATRMLPNLRGR